MIKLTNAALFFLAAGIFTSVTVLAGFQTLFTISIVYYTYLAFKNKTFQLPKSAWWLLGFVVIAIISLAINYELIPKPSKNWGRIKYFLFGVGGIYVFRVWLVEASDNAKKILINTFLLSVVLAGIYAMYNFSTSLDGRAKGFTDTMRYGYGSAMMLLVLLSALLHRKKIETWFDWRMAGAAFIFGFIGMYVTYTRGALLGFLCGLPFVLYYYRAKIGLLFGGIALVAIVGLASMYLFGSGNYQSRFLVNKNNASDVIRRSQWQAAVISIKERPILGWGLSNFHSQLKRIKHDYDLDAKDYNDQHSHNVFLEVASGTGLIGLFFFLAWLIMWAWECFRTVGLTRALTIPFGVAFVISGQFEVTLDANNASMIFFVYALSVARITKVEKL